LIESIGSSLFIKLISIKLKVKLTRIKCKKLLIDTTLNFEAPLIPISSVLVIVLKNSLQKYKMDEKLYDCNIQNILTNVNKLPNLIIKNKYHKSYSIKMQFMYLSILKSLLINNLQEKR